MIIPTLKLFSDAHLPQRATPGANCFDLFAYHVIDRQSREIAQLPYEIEPGKIALIGIGLKVAIPFPVVCHIIPRSGVSMEFSITIPNSPGTIDSDYRGEAAVLIRNYGIKPFLVRKGIRIAQAEFLPTLIPHFEVVESLPPTPRDIGGFGSTGEFDIILGEEAYHQAQSRLDQVFMDLAISASGLSNCLRGAERNPDGTYKKDADGRYIGVARRFGCVFTTEANVVAWGFNMRTGDCSEETGCIRETKGIPSGQANDIGCLHAEEVALQNYSLSGGPPLKGAVVYVNSEPCVKCAKIMCRMKLDAIVVPEGVYPTNGLPIMRDAGVEIRYVMPRLAK